ncbi:MAG: hypothetical protein H6871_04470 [Methylobacteriaceae bacterium]|nr:hypothetical protein [Methylobacteriaceae bacterium]
MVNRHGRCLRRHLRRNHSVLETLAQRIQEISTTLTDARRQKLVLHTRTAVYDALVQPRAGINAESSARNRRAQDLDRERGEGSARLLSARTGDLHSIFDTKGSLLIDLLTARGDEVSKELASVGETRHQRHRAARLGRGQHLARKQGEVAVALDRSTAALREAIETSAGQSVSAVTGAHRRSATD